MRLRKIWREPDNNLAADLFVGKYFLERHMTTPSSEQIEAALASLNELISQAADFLGRHPHNRELQTKFAKLVIDRDKLEQHQTPRL